MLKYILQALLFFYCSNFSKAQVLNIPPRNPADQNASQIIISINNLTLEDREAYVFSELTNRNIPDFYRNLTCVTDSTLIEGVYKHISYYNIML